MAQGHISTQPTAGLSYSPLDAHYYDEGALKQELDRVFDICHGCRLCFNLCPSFPALFDAIDKNDTGVSNITKKQTQYVVDACYQCKACYSKCPYTADDGHAFKLDFPQLMQRAKAIQTQQEGVRFRDRLLSAPDLLGKMAALMGRLSAWMLNGSNRLRAQRWLMEKLVGIHRHKLLPDCHGQTFTQWIASKHAKVLALNGKNGKIVYFPTCFVNYNEPEIGRAALRVFSRNQLDVKVYYQQCCGMPALNTGNVAKAQEMARKNVAQMLPYVREGRKILLTNPTCSMMMRKEYPELIAGKEVKELANAIRDPSEYLNEMRRAGTLNTHFASSPQKVRYHVPCHLRVQKIGYRSRDLLKAIDGVHTEVVTECCGHNGTWAMKKEWFEASLKAGKKAFDGMQGEGEMMTECPLAAIQFEQVLGKRPLHPLQVLDLAYESDGFKNKVSTND